MFVIFKIVRANNIHNFVNKCSGNKKMLMIFKKVRVLNNVFKIEQKFSYSKNVHELKNILKF